MFEISKVHHIGFHKYRKVENQSLLQKINSFFQFDPYLKSGYAQL